MCEDMIPENYRCTNNTLDNGYIDIMITRCLNIIGKKDVDVGLYFLLLIIAV